MRIHGKQHVLFHGDVFDPTHTHTTTRTHTQSRTHAQAHTHSHPYTHTQTHKHAHIYTRTHTHTYTRTRAYTLMHIHATHTRTHNRTYTHIHVHHRLRPMNIHTSFSNMPTHILNTPHSPAPNAQRTPLDHARDAPKNAFKQAHIYTNQNNDTNTLHCILVCVFCEAHNLRCARMLATTLSTHNQVTTSNRIVLGLDTQKNAVYAMLQTNHSKHQKTTTYRSCPTVAHNTLVL